MFQKNMAWKTRQNLGPLLRVYLLVSYIIKTSTKNKGAVHV